MEIDAIRASIRKGSFFVTDHALTEGFKDGISVADIRHVIQTGKIIERYPGRRRCLVYGHNAAAIPVHVVVDFSPGRSSGYCHHIRPPTGPMDKKPSSKKKQKR